MQNKNVELCKLLKIPPKYRISTYSGTHLVDSLDEVKPLLCDLDMNSKDIIKNAVEIYPDLYKPDNFVKLLEMPNVLINSADFESYTQKDYIGNLAQAILAFGFDFIDRESFLSVLNMCVSEIYFEDMENLLEQVSKIEFRYL